MRASRTIRFSCIAGSILSISVCPWFKFCFQGIEHSPETLINFNTSQQMIPVTAADDVLYLSQKRELNVVVLIQPMADATDVLNLLADLRVALDSFIKEFVQRCRDH
jgi:hypothetical protein